MGYYASDVGRPVLLEPNAGVVASTKEADIPLQLVYSCKLFNKPSPAFVRVAVAKAG